MACSTGDRLVAAAARPKTPRSPVIVAGVSGDLAALLGPEAGAAVITPYAVRDGAFLRWFGDVALPAATVAAMQQLAADGARALELEVFGGDIARDGNGGLSLIDLNDWPRYGRGRFEAAEAIASYVRKTRIS